MKRLWKLVYSNKFFAIATLLMQLGFIVAYAVGVSSNARFYLLASNFISALLILIEVNRREESSFKITWIMLVAIIPIFGWFFYLYTHTGVISKNIKDAHLTLEKRVGELKTDDSAVIKEMDARGCETSLVKYLSKANKNSVYKNSSVEYYPLGDVMFEAIKTELQKAQEFIFMEFFIINKSSRMWNEIEAILADKAKHGVDVRLMYDGMGCMGIMPKDYDRVLRDKGIMCEIFSPVQPLLSTYQNNRDHRKVIVIDGKCAFSGGINLADEYINEKERFGHWKDTGIRVCGEGVSGFTEMFLTMWGTVSDLSNSELEYYIKNSRLSSLPEERGYIVPYDDSPLDDKPVGRNAYVDILNTAKRYVHIMTPYFVIDESIFQAMEYAVTRGVDVKLILPGIPDKKMPYCLARSYYKELFEIGVEVYEYAPGFVHAKTTVSDDTRAVVGTVNYDYRSLYLHYECGAYIYGSDCVHDIERDMIDTLAKCRRFTLTEYNMLPWYYRFMGRVLRFIATMI